MAKINSKKRDSVVLLESASGYSVVPASTPLTRLNYYDGLFLRASHLKLEQDYFLELIGQSNQAGGSGPVHGFDLDSAAGAELSVREGMAIDGVGRVLLLPQTITIPIADLIARSQFVAVSSSRVLAGAVGFEDCVVEERPAPDDVVAGSELFLVTVAHVDALCGEEDVYGKLCEEACVTSTERPFRIDGLVFRARPLILGSRFKTTGAEDLGALHTRSLVAAAFYEDERLANPSSISGAGLRSGVWCNGALSFSGGREVPLGVLGHAGGTTTMLDMWIARRERMEASPRRYWAWKMAMRPWNVFLAQVLQFQCQLRDVLSGGGGGDGGEDPCAEVHEVLRNASHQIESILAIREYIPEKEVMSVLGEERIVGRAAVELEGLGDLHKLREELNIAAREFFSGPSDRILIRGGIVETPSAGYLPVVPISTVSVNEQVRRLLGDGVDLRFCAVRPDFIPHALEEAQHMERICLLQGLDNQAAKPKVDVLVPDGEIKSRETRPDGRGYVMELELHKDLQSVIRAIAAQALSGKGGIGLGRHLARTSNQLAGIFATVAGAARGARLSSGGYELYFAGRSKAELKGRATKDSSEATPIPIEDLEEVLGRARRAGDGGSVLAEGGPIIVTARDRGMAVWMELKVEKDPFTLRQGEATGVSALIGVFDEGGLIELTLNGSLDTTRSFPSNDRGRSLEVSLSGDLGVRSEEDSGSIVIHERLTLASSRKGVGSMVAVAWHRPKVLGGISGQDIVFVREWTSASQNRFSAVVRDGRSSLKLLQRVDAAVALFKGGQTIDDRALLAGHRAHDLSTDALARMADASGLVRYRTEAPRKLFPPPQESSEDVTIHATRDWVFFHRRRTKNCGVVEPPSVQVSPRRYRVFHAEVGNAADVERIAAELRSYGSSEGLEARPVAEVTFSANNSTLKTPAEVVRDEWLARVPDGVEIAYAAIGSVGEARDDGAALAEARLRSLGVVLDDVTPIADGFSADVLPAIPPSEVVGNADGAILILTLRMQIVCHEVFRVEGDPDTLIEQARLGFRDFAKTFSAVRVGQYEFRSGEGRFAEAPLPPVSSAWQAVGDRAIAGTIIFRSQLNGELQQEPLKEQALTLQKASTAEIAFDEGGMVVIETDEALEPCGVVTVLIARPQLQTVCNEVIAFNDIVAAETAKSVFESVAAGSLPIDGGRVQRVTTVDFDETSNQVIQQSLDEFKEVWASNFVPLSEGVHLEVGSISRLGSTADDIGRHAAQASVIAGTISDGAEVVDITFDDEVLPSDCRSMTFLVPVKTANRNQPIPIVIRTVAPDIGDRPVSVAFRFDEEREVIRDDRLEGAIALLKRRRVRLTTVDFVGRAKPRDNDKRITSLLKLFREEGLVTDATTRSTRKVEGAERKLLQLEGFEMPNAFVLTAKRQGRG